MTPILLIVTALAWDASVYKCTVNGQTVYSQSPCAEDAEEMDTEDLAKDTGLSGDPSLTGQMDEGRHERSVDRRIGIMRKRSAQVIRGYEREIRQCERKAARALNNLAGATYEQTQRECVANYEKLISDERIALEDRVMRVRQNAQPN